MSAPQQPESKMKRGARRNLLTITSADRRRRGERPYIRHSACSVFLRDCGPSSREPEPCMLDPTPRAVTALLPDRRALCGPVTRARLARLAAIYAAVFTLGLLLAFGTSSPQLQAFGLGLMAPGGGFLAHADVVSVHGLVHLAVGLAAFAAFAIALVAWFATGNVLAPPLLWLLSAVLAALMDHGPVQNRAAVP